MIELPERIDMAREYADSVSVREPGFWVYAEDVIRDFRNGTEPVVTTERLARLKGTQADRNLRAILRGELRWPA